MTSKRIKVVSFDVGIKNLSFCRLEVTPSAIGRVARVPDY